MPYKTSYDLFEAWVERCLKDSRSLLFDEPDIWTEANIDKTRQTMLKRLIEGSRKRWEEKLEIQFSDSDDKTWLMLCDLATLHYCPNSHVNNLIFFEKIVNKQKMNYEEIRKKTKSVQDTSGVARMGYDYNRHLWFSIGYWSCFALKYKQNQNLREIVEKLIQGQPCWEESERMFHVKNIIDDEFKQDMNDKPVNEKNKPHSNILLHMLCPKYHYRMFSFRDRADCMSTFSKYLNGKEKTENERIYTISEKLKQDPSLEIEDSPSLGESRFVNFYIEPLKSRWKKGKIVYKQERINTAKPLEQKELDKRGSRPVKTEKVSQKLTYKTDNRISGTVLRNASFKCEFDETHETFKKNKTDYPFVEAHHLIPMAKAGEFYPIQIDRAENIVALCPNCHRAVHLGNKEEKEIRLKKLYDMKIDGLREKGFNITFKKLMQFYK